MEIQIPYTLQDLHNWDFRVIVLVRVQQRKDGTLKRGQVKKGLFTGKFRECMQVRRRKRNSVVLFLRPRLLRDCHKNLQIEWLVGRNSMTGQSLGWSRRENVLNTASSLPQISWDSAQTKPASRRQRSQFS